MVTATHVRCDIRNLNIWPYWWVVSILFMKMLNFWEVAGFSDAPSVSCLSVHSAYCHIHYVSAESADLNADGTVEYHFPLEEFSALPLTPNFRRAIWCCDVHLFQLISHRIWQAMQMGISVELREEYLVHAKAHHKHGFLSGSDESTYSELCSMPWPPTGTMRHLDLLSPRSLHIPNTFPSDFCPSPKLLSTPKNNQTVALPYPLWYFRISFVVPPPLPPKASQIFWPFTYWLAVGKVPNFPVPVPYLPFLPWGRRNVFPPKCKWIYTALHDFQSRTDDNTLNCRSGTRNTWKRVAVLYSIQWPGGLCRRCTERMSM